MSDKKPNLALEAKRLELRLSEMNVNLQRYEIRRLELQDEVDRLDANSDATRKEIENIESQIKSLKGVK